MLALFVEDRQQILPGDLLPAALTRPELLVRGVGGDAIQPAAERRFALEHVDLPGCGPEGVLDDLLGILLIARDPDREPVHAVAVRGDERLGRAGILSAQCLDEGSVAIDARGGRRAAVSLAGALQ